jgi:hypothetical protein
MSLFIWWKLDGNGNDSSGNGNNGTITNATSTTTAKIGTAYFFNNNDARVVTSGDLDLRGDLTFSAWVYPTDLTTTTEDSSTIRGIVSNLNHPSTSGFSMFINASKLYVHVGFTDGTRADAFVGATVFQANRWYHVSMVYADSTRRLTTYIDGVQESTVALAKQPRFLPQRVIAGQWAFSYINNYEFIGNIDDVRVYDEALSAREVEELSRAKVLHYSFDDPSEIGTNNLIGTTPLSVGVYAYASGPVSTANIPDENLGPRTVSRFTITQAVNSARANIIAPVTANKTYTFSFMIKYNGTVTGSPTLFNDASKGSPEASGSNTLANVTNTFTYVSNGWYRARYTFTVTATPTGNAMLTHGITTSTTSAYIGETFDTYNYQLEESANATPFTATIRNGVIRDVSGYSNNTSVPAASAPLYTSSSKIGPGAMLFNGAASQHLNLTEISSMPFNTGITFSVWAYPTASSNWARFVDFGSGAPSNNILFTRVGSTTTLALYSHNVTTESVISAADAMQNNVWQHFAFTIASNGAAKIYKNGSVIASGTLNVPNLVTRTNMYIGRSNWVADSYYDGSMDDIRLYTTALSDGDILTLYSNRASVDSLGNVHATEFDQVDEPKFSSQYNSVNLVENGSGQLGTNYNFTGSGTSVTYSTADSYDGDGKSFTRAGSATIISNEFIKVSRYNTYRLVGALRSIGAGGLSYTFFGLACYDKDKNFIEHVMSAHYSNTRTTLAQTLNNGDTVVTLSSAANWVVGTAGTSEYNKVFAVYNNSNYPVYTYSRINFNYLTVSGNTITLQSAWSGGTIAAGTPVANSYNGSGYNYLYINSSLPSSWTLATNTITNYATTGSETAFRYGTEFVRILFLTNYAQGATFETRFDAIQLYNISTFQPYRSPQGPMSTGVFEAMEMSEVGVYDNLQAYYPFDGNANDLSGNSYNGTVEVATLTSGVRGGAYNFTAGSLITANNALTGVFTNQRFSWGCWFMRTATNGISQRLLMSGNNFLELSSTSGSKVAFTLQGTNGVYETALSLTTVANNTWYHAFGTYAEGTARIYINGALEATLSKADFGNSGTTLLIGNWSNKAQDFLGKIDEVRVYSRALSAEEVAILYDSTRPASTVPVRMTGQDIFTAGEFNETEI